MCDGFLVTLPLSVVIVVAELHPGNFTGAWMALMLTSALVANCMSCPGVPKQYLCCHLFQTSDLLSGIGSQISLWLGMSIISTYEILEYIIELVAIATARCCPHKRPRNEVKDMK